MKTIWFVKAFGTRKNMKNEKYGWLSWSLFKNVFEKFIDTCLKYYELDHCHYFSAPGLSWNAMLKMTGVKLEKLSDIDKY